MPERINPSPTRREQVTTVHAGIKRDSKVMACQNLDLEGICKFDEKTNRSGIQLEWSDCECIIEYMEPIQ